MSELSYDMLCYQACEGLDQKAIWWVDDCFYIDDPDTGGYLPLNILRKGPDAIAPCVFGLSGEVYLELHGIAQRDKLGLRVCSFEYAAANWDRLNSADHILLWDVGYTGKGFLYGLHLYNGLVAGSK